MPEVVSWIATVATIVAASMTAANLGARVTGFGFAVFVVGSLSWLATGLMTNQPALVWTNVVLTVLNLFGVWRWLGRQARVEEGARTAAEASEGTPGEALFPLSLLSRAPVEVQSGEAGTCIDGMAGCRSGRLAYVVVSQGGIAGVGETLRRLPWSEAHVEGDRLIAHLDQTQFERLEQLPKDEWPAR